MVLSGLKVLVVEDEDAMRAVLESRLGGWGIDTVSVPTLAAAEKALEKFRPSVVVSDVKLPDGSGVDLLDRLEKGVLDAPVILVTAHGSIELAVTAMRRGAFHFLTKPIDYGRLQEVIEAARAGLRGRERSSQVVERVESAERFGGLIGSSKAMRQVFATLAEIAPTQAAVLLTGESGTGKDLAARAIHASSRRSDGEFVAINSAAIPSELMESEIFGHEKGAFTGAVETRAGCFELADGGTLFLDEIAEMPIQLQPKLLRVLEDGKVRRLGSARETAVDVRVLAATNRPPAEAIEEKALREDLYYRLNVFQVELPPLRRRPEDIPLLVEHFVERFNQVHATRVEGASDQVMDQLRSHSWPGNVRELRNLVERCVVLAKEGRIEPDHLGSSLESGNGSRPSQGAPVGTTIADAERDLILRTLDATGNNKAEAARRLGIDVKTVRNKLKAWGVDR